MPAFKSRKKPGEEPHAAREPRVGQPSPIQTDRSNCDSSSLYDAC